MNKEHGNWKQTLSRWKGSILLSDIMRIMKNTVKKIMLESKGVKPGREGNLPPIFRSTQCEQDGYMLN